MIPKIILDHNWLTKSVHPHHYRADRHAEWLFHWVSAILTLIKSYHSSAKTYLIELTLTFCGQKKVKQLLKLLIGVILSNVGTFELGKIDF